jgi:hypothetical protein
MAVVAAATAVAAAVAVVATAAGIVVVVAVAADERKLPSGDPLAERASQIGEAWALEYVRTLTEQSRAPVGAWPGTMSEARTRVVLRLAVALDPKRLDELARVANLAARRGWQEVCQPDPEM